MREINLYTSRETNIVHEAKFVDERVLVRPVSPQDYRDIQNLSLNEFEESFDDFYGDRDKVRKWIIDAESPEIEVNFA